LVDELARPPVLSGTPASSGSDHTAEHGGEEATSWACSRGATGLVLLVYRHYRGKLRRLLWRLKAADGRPLMALVVVVSGFWKSGRKETEVV
jgi:hypothetical protein